MIYYPDEGTEPSWAGPALGALGYNSNPAKLQMLIRKTFQEAVSTIQIEGSPVIAVPLFHALDGKNPEDYVQRVEPSPTGGKKMAELLLDIMDSAPYVVTNPSSAAAAVTAPASSSMLGRK